MGDEREQEETGQDHRQLFFEAERGAGGVLIRYTGEHQAEDEGEANQQRFHGSLLGLTGRNGRAG